MTELFAVHISDAVLTPWAWISADIIAGLGLAAACRRLDDEFVPRLGLFTAVIFVASQIHVPAGPVSMHLLLNTVTGIVLGSRAIIAIAVAVFLQALLFAHGGLTTWGINTLTLSIPGIIAGRVFRGINRHSAKWAFPSGLLIGWFTAATTIALAASAVYTLGIESRLAVGAVVISQLPVIGLEGIITATLTHYLSRVKPQWLHRSTGVTSSSGISH